MSRKFAIELRESCKEVFLYRKIFFTKKDVECMLYIKSVALTEDGYIKLTGLNKSGLSTSMFLTLEHAMELNEKGCCDALDKEGKVKWSWRVE